MSLTKKDNTQAKPATPKAEAPKELPSAKMGPAATPKAAEPKAEAPAEEKPKARERLVKVNNLRRYHYVQPGTGITIQGHEREKQMRDDAWLELQCKARILERS